MRTHFAKYKWAAVLLLAGATAAFAGNDKWVIHEWGTFTSLQDESGAAISGINTDDEALPAFVHRLSDRLILPPGETPPIIGKGLVVRSFPNPDVTMRMETPVLYFHPPASVPHLTGINVEASFHGGWLSEFYPKARADAPGLNLTNGIGRLRENTTGTLAWENLEVGGDWPGPATDAHVWTSPRTVASAPVRTPSGEAERFLFYRGVGHIDAPLRVSRDERAGELVLQSQLSPGIAGEKGLPVRALWLVDIQPDGRVAFRDIPSATLEGRGKVLARVPSTFRLDDYASGNLDKLKAELGSALVADGLYGDEAQALLNTWELSYFKSAGLRLFFIVPRAWTDSYLSLKVSVPAEIDRVMVGRIELVTPAQRRMLQEIGRAPDAESNKLYLGLGRFRNALVLNEAARRPAVELKAFMTTHFGPGFFDNPEAGVRLSGPEPIAGSSAP